VNANSKNPFNVQITNEAISAQMSPSPSNLTGIGIILNQSGTAYENTRSSFCDKTFRHLNGRHEGYGPNATCETIMFEGKKDSLDKILER
jgi:hypothetical protein